MNTIRSLLKVTTLGAMTFNFACLSNERKKTMDEQNKADSKINQLGFAVTPKPYRSNPGLFLKCGFNDENEAGSAQNKSTLHMLASEVLKVRSSLPLSYRTPIIVKLTPDLSEQDVQEIIDIVNKEECPVDGLIVTGKTVERWTNLKSFNSDRSGGWLGLHFLEKSIQFAAKVIVIGGGAFRGREQLNQILNGASAV
ncbi:dihydroorotate dehydrogenase (quinone), mitochondrial-like [Sabethes cyaneus]|uniref:dihydroorotate dehydrogenase (quinone), mitochondrial-like n=1 Tax=Sabethes cyaneus TaxID=53552 RepID=UPI00237D3A26|nr:dihydroorotate dehydrogenase (quinone), mitochondrial-like [Sabethes cyaneus]